MDLASDCGSSAHAGALQQSLLPRAGRTRSPRSWSQRSGFARAFFCNSGTEANEAAIKLARKRAFRKGETDRVKILACTGSFHGRTLGALAATANDKYKEGFGPMPDGFAFTEFNDMFALDKAIDDTVAAFIVEPVQGESGVHPASVEFLAMARHLCDKRGALLIFDEIQCGMGRLGPLFAFQRFGVRPDVVTMAKALANGLPIGAMLVRGDARSTRFNPAITGRPSAVRRFRARPHSRTCACATPST